MTKTDVEPGEIAVNGSRSRYGHHHSNSSNSVHNNSSSSSNSSNTNTTPRRTRSLHSKRSSSSSSSSFSTLSSSSGEEEKEEEEEEEEEEEAERDETNAEEKKWKARRWLLAASSLLLLAEIAVYRQDMAATQSADCHITAALRRATPFSDYANDFFINFHQWTSSFVWMQFAVALSFFWDAERGAELFTIVVFGHMLKNFSKSFLRSPRGFWFCKEGHALSCGKGFSLPSGHTMMATIVFLWLAHHVRRWYVFAGVGVSLLFIVWNVLYIGTHTRADVLFGATFGVVSTALFLNMPRTLQRVFSGGSPTLRRTHRPRDSVKYRDARNTHRTEIRLLLLFLAVSLAVFQLEVLEIHWDEDDSVFPIEWQQTYETYCQLPAGVAAAYMRHNSAYEKTALACGWCVGMFLRALWQIGGSHPRDKDVPLWKRILRTAIATAAFSASPLAFTLLLPETETAARFRIEYASVFFQPILFLALLPAALQAVGLGHFDRPFELSPSSSSPSPQTNGHHDHLS